MVAGINSDYNRFRLNQYKTTGSQYRHPDISKNYNNDGCTDGKDDGSIEISDIGENLFKGIGKTFINAAKGCFFDDKGDFSIGRTLFTAGTAAVCIACPPVGLAACALGVGSGALQTLKGLYNVAAANTDKEAKEAWQNIGSGVVTAGVSALGSKASFGAMKNSSKLGTGESAIEQLQNKRVNSSLKDISKAWWSDIRNSSIHGIKELGKDTVSGIGKAGSSMPKFAESSQNRIFNFAYNAEKNMYKAKRSIERAKTRSVKENLIQAKNSLGDIVNRKNAQNILSTVKTTGKNIKESILNLYNNLTNSNSSYSQAVSKYGYNTAADTLKVFAAEKI